MKLLTIDKDGEAEVSVKLIEEAVETGKNKFIDLVIGSSTSNGLSLIGNGIVACVESEYVLVRLLVVGDGDDEFIDEIVESGRIW